MAITKNNFSLNQNYETGSVDMVFFTVDFINSMAAETGDVTSGSTTAGLDLVRNTINQYATILFEGPLTDSNTQKTYGIRADQANTLGTAAQKLIGTGGILEVAIQALDQSSAAYPCIQADITSATVTETKLGILTVAAVS
jgi:hypothetical protein